MSTLMDLPLDVFLEIAAYLVPRDILCLSRLSKRLRDILLSVTSRAIWKSARKQIPALPDCPPDLSEPQYADLMFEPYCHVCSKPIAKKIDFHIRVRCCVRCFKDNVMKGLALPVNGVVLAFLMQTHQSPNQKKGAVSREAFYFRPHALAMQNKIARLKALPPPAWSDFAIIRKAALAEAAKTVHDLENWYERRGKHLSEGDQQDAETRKMSIERHLLESGWSHEDLALVQRSPEYMKIVFHPKPLSSKGWGTLINKLDNLRTYLLDHPPPLVDTPSPVSNDDEEYFDLRGLRKDTETSGKKSS